MSDALRPAVSGWSQKIRLSWDFKKKEFGDNAEECARFFDGPYDWLYGPTRFGGARGFEFGGDDELPGPAARMTINKTAELVQLFGPALYHRNPVRKVVPRHVPLPPPALYGDPGDPLVGYFAGADARRVSDQWMADSARADLIERYLNYTPTALDLKTEARWAIDEAIVKGMGCLWTCAHRPPGATCTWAGTFFGSVDDLLLDPDALSYRDIKWMARRRVRPVWEVEREFGLPAGTLKSHASLESYTATAAAYNDPEGDYRRKQGRTADLVVYWEVYSKMGFGGRLAGVAETSPGLDSVGDFAYLCVMDGCPYPLNLPPPYCDALADPASRPDLLAEVQRRLEWQTPYWADDEWPMTPIVFHWRPHRLWPMSHMWPGIGELKFLNWAWSFLAAKVRRASRDFLAIAKAAGEDLKDRIKHGPDYTVVEVENMMGSIDQVVKFLQHPPFQKDIYEVIEGVSQNFERRVGLTELMYGLSGKQIRSAQEAQVKESAVSVRPDDMANCVEDAMTDAARKEAFAARWHLRGPDVVGVLGPVGARLWEQLVVPSDPASVIYGLQYRIEANSARKPNKALDQANMQQAVQQLFQPLFVYGQQTGNIAPVNALIRDWARSMDLDASAYLLTPPPPPPPPAPGAGPGAGPGPKQAGNIPPRAPAAANGVPGGPAVPAGLPPGGPVG